MLGKAEKPGKNMAARARIRLAYERPTREYHRGCSTGNQLGMIDRLNAIL